MQIDILIYKVLNYYISIYLYLLRFPFAPYYTRTGFLRNFGTFDI